MNDCSLKAPQKCLNNHCEYAEVFADRMMCMLYKTWFDLTPVHFKCIDVMRETQGDEAVQDFCICNAIKYIYRHRNKNGVEDIKKAKWYIDKYLEIEGEKKTEPQTERSE